MAESGNWRNLRGAWHQANAAAPTTSLVLLRAVHENVLWFDISVNGVLEASGPSEEPAGDVYKEEEAQLLFCNACAGFSCLISSSYSSSLTTVYFS